MTHQYDENLRYASVPRSGLSKLLVIGSLAGAAIAAFAGAFVWIMSSAALDPEISLNAGVRLLKKGQPSEAKMLVAALGDAEPELASQKAKKLLILGAASLEEAENLQAPRFRYSKATEAQKLLADANVLGFPRGFEGFGKFLLGKALFQLFRWDEAKEPLQESLNNWPNGRTQAIDRLIDIELHAKKSDRARIQQLLDQWDRLPGITVEDRELGAIKRMEVALEQGDWDTCIELSQAYPADARLAPRAGYFGLVARLNRSDASNPASTKELQEIESQLREIMRSPQIDWRTRLRTEFALGRTLQYGQRWKEALTAFSSIQQRAPDSVEGLIAAIEVMRVMLELQDYTGIAKTQRQLTEQMGQLEWYNNAWVSFEEMRERINAIGNRLLEAEAYPEALEFAAQQPPFCERKDRLRIEALANHRWATKLRGSEIDDDVMLDIRDASQQQAAYDDINKQQQALYAKAARAYEELARIEMRLPGYHDLIWAAIDCSQAAGEPAYCNSLIVSTIDFEPRNYQPRSLIKMAENHFAMQQPDKSLILLDRCVSQFSDHPLSFQARLNSARILNEQGNVDEAVKRLEENLYLSGLTPENITWKESLFELGKAFYNRGEKIFFEAQQLQEEIGSDKKTLRLQRLEASHDQFLESIARLEEWSQRYPEDSRRFDTLYNVGQAYRMAAYWPKVLVEEKQLPSEDLIRGRMLETKRLLESAERTYKEIREGISASRDWKLLDPAQQRLLRNSYFAEADLMFQAKHYDRALGAYRNIANRLANEPESLEALVQVAECLKYLNRHEESRGVIDQAKELLQQIPPTRDELFISLTRFNRAGWTKHLDSLSQTKL